MTRDRRDDYQNKQFVRYREKSKKREALHSSKTETSCLGDEPAGFILGASGILNKIHLLLLRNNLVFDLHSSLNF